jgi:miniconductance mechanosensitive channel
MGNILNIKVSNAKTITAINNFLILVVVLVFIIILLIYVDTITTIKIKKFSEFLKKFLFVVIATLIYAITSSFALIRQFVEIVLVIYISFMGVSIFNVFVGKLNSVYETYYKHAKEKPIKGFLSVLKWIVFFIVLIIVLSKIVGKSPVYLLSGIGALSAILMLIFKDSILGFVAGFQMSSNDLVRIGDWIEMPKYGADGDVIDITLTFVKVRNWDKTIITIPAYALVSESFKNWRGMFATGGRRIKRSINIDVNSISFCSNELLDKLSKVEFLKDYIIERSKEIEEHNKERNINVDIPINGRRLTNIGVFRKYISEYINRHPKIHKELITMVRQLQTDNTGVPLEIYAFTNDTAWVNYEDIMADIFDHIYAATSFFGLQIYQEPSGRDISSISVAQK